MMSDPVWFLFVAIGLVLAFWDVELYLNRMMSVFVSFSWVLLYGWIGGDVWILWDLWAISRMTA
ncbi:hypothetical protein V8C26DRAFT_413698 [Trichoderma gracile]